MAKLVLADIALVGTSLETLINTVNDNSALIETAVENTLSRDGTHPNFMDADLDMNGYCIINLGCIDFIPGGIDNLAYLNLCNIYTKGQSTQHHAATINGGAYTPVSCNSNVHRILLDQDLTIGAPIGPLSGQVMNFILKQDSTGGRTVTWNAAYKWPGGTPPTMSTDPNAVDVISMQYDATDGVWYAVFTQNFL